MKPKKLRMLHKAKVCMYCEDVFTPTNPETLEHVIPKSKGGNDTLEDTGLACNRCNALRANMSFLEFSRACGNKAEKHEKEAGRLRLIQLNALKLQAIEKLKQ